MLRQSITQISLYNTSKNSQRGLRRTKLSELYTLQTVLSERVFSLPGKIFIPGTQTAAEPEAKVEDDDFFNNWDKPSSPTPAAEPAAKPAAPPTIGRTASHSSTNSIPSDSTAISPQPQVSPPSTTPRTISSASLRQSSSSARPAKATSKLGASKFGAKKAATPFNYDEAEKKAQLENERLKELELEAHKRAEEEKTKQAAEAEASAAAAAIAAQNAEKARKEAKTASPSVEKVEPRMARLGFGQTAGAKSTPAASS